MKKIVILMVAFLSCGCVEIDTADNYSNVPQNMNYASVPYCRNETTVAVYDELGTYQIPGCVEYDTPEIRADKISDDGDIDPNDIPGSFPAVENNKYVQNQVIMQNLNSRVLAYCRGSDSEIAYCIQRLENSCYVRLSDIPKVTAKYDTLRRGAYPARRWHEGDVVPRW